tara:strand:- start:1291 stop:1641 length:351 start_codon:yes stop_codon:yes gene_type:complete
MKINWKKIEAGLYEADMGDGFTIQCAKYHSEDYAEWGYKYWSYMVTWTGVTIDGHNRVIDHTPNCVYEPTLKECKESAVERYIFEAQQLTAPSNSRNTFHSHSSTISFLIPQVEER